MKIKVLEASGPVLDWMVWEIAGGPAAYPKMIGQAFLRAWRGNSTKYLHPSTDWSQGGPIIEREGIDIYHREASTLWSAAIWRDLPGGGQLMCKQRDCPTPLIAAMRCFVASKLGDEVEVSDELTS